MSRLFTRILKRSIADDFKFRPKPLKTKKAGIDILHDPLWNKGLAFDIAERDRLGLRGLLPPIVKKIDAQVEFVRDHLRSQDGPVAKSLYLQELHNRNETLFHRLLVEYMEEIAPLVYTPTVGTVCQQFGRMHRRTRGMYFSANDRNQFSSMVYNWPHDDVHVIVVTDGSRILGLGDLGVHGMGIPIGKLALYCAAGGIAPHRCLPVVLDVGTNNEALLNDPYYLGLRQKRLEGPEYFDMVDEFIQAVFGRWPGVVVQFEDFESHKAAPLLERYRHQYRVFNDDIQGTGCVTLSGIISAASQIGVPFKDLKFMCAGAGSAGLGVCDQLVRGLVEAGLTREEAKSRFVVCTAEGAVGVAVSGGKTTQHAHSPTAAWVNSSVSDGATLLQAMQTFKPNVLLGLSAQGGIFTEELITEMAKHHSRPIIMPMSNPTSKAECTPEQAYTWTNGAALVATGSPFPSSTIQGKTYTPSQCNNMYIFPGLGLAASVAGVTKITDKMLYTAAVACAGALTSAEIADGRTFPDIKRIREVSHAVACAVIKKAMEEGLTTKLSSRNMDAGGLANLVKRKMYYPNYVPLVDPK